MAIKAALAAALLVALVSLASATTHTTTSFDEAASQNWQQCSMQVQGRPFRACQRYLQQRGSPYADEEEEVLDTAPYYYPQQGLQACCQELKQMDRQHCGCEALRHAMRQAQQSLGPYFQTGQSQQIYQKARALPSRCGLREQQCRFRLVFV